MYYAGKMANYSRERSRKSKVSDFRQSFLGCAKVSCVFIREIRASSFAV